MNNIGISFLDRESKKCGSRTIGQIGPGTGLEQCSNNCLVAWSAVTKNNCFNKSGPSKVVDMVKRRLSRN